MRDSTKNCWDLAWEDLQEADHKPSPHIIKPITDIFKGEIQNKRILEVGAGTGANISFLAKLGAEAYSLDFAANSIKIIRRTEKRYEVNIEPLMGDAQKMPFSDNSFDLVFSQGLMEHFHNPKRAFEEQIRVAKNRSYILVDVPQTFHPLTVKKHLLMRVNRWFAGWETQYSYPDILRLENDLPFKLIQVFHWSIPKYRLLEIIGEKSPYFSEFIGGVFKVTKK